MEQAAPRSASFPRSSAFSRSADRLRFRLPRSLDQPPEQFPNDVLGRHSPRFRAHRLGRLSKRLARDLRGLSTHREDVIAEKERTVQAEGKGGLDFAQPIERHHRRRFARGLSISRSQPRLTSSRSFAPASNDLNPRASPAVRWLMCVSLKTARISSALRCTLAPSASSASHSAFLARGLRLPLRLLAERLLLLLALARPRLLLTRLPRFSIVPERIDRY